MLRRDEGVAWGGKGVGDAIFDGFEKVMFF